MDTIKTGKKTLIEMIGSGTLTVIAGRPGTCKSAHAIHLAGKMAEKGKRVLFFDLELSEQAVRSRMSEYGFEAYGNNVIVYDEPNIGVEYITQKAASAEKVDAIFVDYIQLMRGKNNKLCSCRQEVEEIVSGLKQLAVKMNVTMIVVSQLGRNADGGIDSIRKAGFREQDTDWIILPPRMFM